jgi:hypothetical protein
LAVDGPAAALLLTSVTLVSLDSADDYETREQNAEMLAVLGTLVYGAGAPTVHLFHRQPWHALGSLGMRVALPAFGGGIGMGLAQCPPPTGDYGNCGVGELFFGAAVGALAAIAVDASLVAWESPKVSARPATSTGAHIGLSPVVSTDGHRELRLFGTF